MLDLLVVDDNEDHLKLLAAILADERRSLWLASTAERAIELMGDRAFAMGIFDVRIPGTDGIELAAIMRDTQGAGVPVVFLSAAKIERVDLLRIGALSIHYDMLLKPIDPALLEATTARSLLITQPGAAPRPARARAESA